MNLIRLIESARLSEKRAMLTTEDKWDDIKSSALSVRNTRQPTIMNLNYRNDFTFFSIFITHFHLSHSFFLIVEKNRLAIMKHR